MHDTDQLRRVCQRDPYISTIFQGVFAADQIPFQELSRLPAWAIIINTDPIDKPGQHWVAAVKPLPTATSQAKGQKQSCFFFDSYGNRPSSYQPHMWRPLENCIHNTEDYQQTYSTVCGDYCLYFLNKMCDPRLRDKSFKFLTRSFDPDDDPGNDRRVHTIVHRRFPRILNVEKHNEFVTQRGGRRRLPLGKLERCQSRRQICIARRYRA